VQKYAQACGRGSGQRRGRAICFERGITDDEDRRLAAAREADPTKHREDALRRDLARIHKSIDRLLTAYQEGLLSLDELRERMPNLRRREQADNAELQAIVDQSADRAAYLRLAETLTTFLTRLRSSADVLDISERQRVLRLLVKDILVGDDKIIIRHSIPLPTGSDGPSARSVNAVVPSTESYLLRSWSQGRTPGVTPMPIRVLKRFVKRLKYMVADAVAIEPPSLALNSPCQQGN
jgi:site-specific DNA recombinase